MHTKNGSYCANTKESDGMDKCIEHAKEQLCHMRVKMNEKIIIYDDIITYVKILVDTNSQCCENENEKMILE